MDGPIIAPSRGDGFVELARTKSGTLFRKHILSTGTLIHPKTKEKIEIDDAYLETMKRNFENNVADIVQAPLVDDNNLHTEDPDKNIGEVVDLQIQDHKLYAVLDARDEERTPKVGKTLLGASAYYHPNYEDSRTGEKVGPTLLHMAITNRPYVVELEPYEQLIAASADGSGEAALLLEAAPEGSEPATEVPTEPPTTEPTNATPPTLEENEMALTKEELIQALLDDHKIDVNAALAHMESSGQAENKLEELTTKLSAVLEKAGASKEVVLKLSNGETVEPDDIVAAVADVAKENVTLSGRLGTLEESIAQERAEAKVEKLVATGYILPAKRDIMVELSRTLDAEKFDALVPDEPLVPLSNEIGTPENTDLAESAAQEYSDRIKDRAKELGYIGG